MIKKLVRRVLNASVWVGAWWAVRSLSDGEYGFGGVPYQCQFASAGLTGDILDKKILASDDPNWKSFGFKTKKDYEYWAWRICGICCVKMILDYRGGENDVSKLTYETQKLGGYNIKTDTGWYYKPMVSVLAKHGSKGGFTVSHLTKYQVAQYINDKKFVIASVNPEIIRFDKNPRSKRKSGHLVLVTGFNVKNGKITGFYINNPSGRIAKTQKHAFIPIDVFTNAFGERGIVIGGQ